MPCLCGDICCPSCGPAQGNWRCPICGVWASEVCEHMDEEGKDIKPEYQALAAQRDKEADEELEQLFKAMDSCPMCEREGTGGRFCGDCGEAYNRDVEALNRDQPDDPVDPKEER